VQNRTQLPRRTCAFERMRVSADPVPRIRAEVRMRMSAHPSKYTSTDADLWKSAKPPIRIRENPRTHKSVDPAGHTDTKAADMVSPKFITELSLTWF
jgi:hypothetical protein